MHHLFRVRLAQGEWGRQAVVIMRARLRGEVPEEDRLNNRLTHHHLFLYSFHLASCTTAHSGEKHSNHATYAVLNQYWQDQYQ